MKLARSLVRARSRIIAIACRAVKGPSTPLIMHLLSGRPTVTTGVYQVWADRSLPIASARSLRPADTCTEE
jgi:hypothetical protein